MHAGDDAMLYCDMQLRYVFSVHGPAMDGNGNGCICFVLSAHWIYSYVLFGWIYFALKCRDG